MSINATQRKATIGFQVDTRVFHGVTVSDDCFLKGTAAASDEEHAFGYVHQGDRA